jgi:hypothetical protein
MDNLNFCEELLQACEDIKIKKQLEKIRKDLSKLKDSDKIRDLVTYMSLCEFAWKIGKELPDSIKVRMLMNQKNYWSLQYLEKHL